ncbi:alcohol dehydrogenase catalytic domain-containing protein [bacterium]|nr:alcohol dehydrogenase catalytic domain-containing protein [bacterium]
MKALVFENELKFHNDYPIPEIKEGEVLIKTSMVGICNTDYEITKGYMGYNGVLGHEFVGVVVDGDKELIGKRVVGEINLACNTCSYCAQGLQRHCPNRQTLGIFNKDGCFSEYFTLPKENILLVPDNISDEEIVFIEPIAAALEILEQVKIEPRYKVALLGDGKLGLSIALVLNAYNIDFVHIGKHEEKLALSSKMGSKTKLLAEISNEYKMSFDIVIEATGSKGGFETSLSLVKPRGTLVLKSTIAANEGLNLASVVVNEITIVGSRCGLFAPAMRLFENNKIDVKPLISHILPFDNALDAFELNKKKEVIKVLLKF